MRVRCSWSYAGKLTGKKQAAKSTGAFANAKNMFQAQSHMGESAAAHEADKVITLTPNP